MSDDQKALQAFSGSARLFPLPNVVLFPHMVMPLHIFEPRYRQMTADALADDKLIAMSLLEPGWESDYEGRPAIHPIACLGRILDHQRLPDGRINLHLRGLSRIRIIREIDSDRLYRNAKVELLQEQPATAEADHQLRSQLLKVVPAWSESHGPAAEVFPKVVQSNLPLEVVCDVLGFSLPLPVEVKQQMLEELDGNVRAQALLTYLQTHSPPEILPPPQRLFPPEFSTN
jgi:Lon protease-like protein